MSSDQPSPTPADGSDATFQREVQRMHRLTVYGRWLVVSTLWLTVGALSLWGLRYPISLILENFTWSAVRYGLVFDRVPALGLFLCIGMTAATLVWQLRNCLFGLPKRDRQRLEKYVIRIRSQGKSHPLWKQVVGKGEVGSRK